jgi:hypothetical protein
VALEKKKEKKVERERKVKGTGGQGFGKTA